MSVVKGRVGLWGGSPAQRPAIEDTLVMGTRGQKETSTDCTTGNNHLWLHRREAEFTSQAACVHILTSLGALDDRKKGSGEENQTDRQTGNTDTD